MPGVWAASSLCGALHRLETWSLFKGDPRQTQLPEDKDHVQMFPFVGFAWLLCRYLCSRSFFCFKFELFRVQIHWFTFFTNEEQKKAGSSTLLPHVLATLIMWQTWSKQMRSKLGFCDLQMYRGFVVVAYKMDHKFALKLLWVLFILFLSIEPVELL